VILKEDITGLGKNGEQVKVKAGYFRNYLLPYGKADLVSARMIKYWSHISYAILALCFRNFIFQVRVYHLHL
jgi:ribosomal protein L9